MADTKRRTPAIPERPLSELQPRPIFFYVPGPPFVAAPASPVIPFRLGQWLGDAVEPLFVRPQYQRFPYFPQEAPAGPVIGFRYGRPLLDDPTVPVPGRHLPFPYFPVAPANPVIEFLRGRWFGDSTEPLVSLSRYLPFPYFQEPARPVIAYRMGQWLGDSVQPLVGAGSRYLQFPYFVQPAPANVIIAYRARLLSELVGTPSDAVVNAPRFYPLVPPSPEAPVVTLGDFIALRRRRRT